MLNKLTASLEVTASPTVCQSAIPSSTTSRSTASPTQELDLICADCQQAQGFGFDGQQWLCPDCAKKRVAAETANFSVMVKAVRGGRHNGID
jgi:hypothetical protein